MEKTVTTYLDSLDFGLVQSHKNLSMFPLLSSQAIDLEYLLLDEALTENCIEITEIDKGGSVPELKLVNKSEKKVLLLDGEELVGAKQNRIINTTILIAAQTTTIIPVSCCEQGRWSYDSTSFSSHKRVMSPNMRAMKSEQVRCNLAAEESYCADQGAIWDEIEEKATRRNARSGSMAMSEIYEKEKGSIEEYRQHFEIVENQVGALFAINGKVVGFDSFGNQDTFSKVFEKLVDSYALDAIDWFDPEKKTRKVKTAQNKFFDSVRTASDSSHRSVALGKDIRLESSAVTGFALIHDKNILHLSAFARQNGNKENNRSSRLQRFSQRRGRVY